VNRRERGELGVLTHASSVAERDALTACRGEGIMFVVRLRSLVLSLLLVAVAATLIQLGITREGVGPFEYLTLALLVALLLQGAYRLSRRAFRRA
jgi:hypothetical protein